MDSHTLLEHLESNWSYPRWWRLNHPRIARRIADTLVWLDRQRRDVGQVLVGSRKERAYLDKLAQLTAWEQEGHAVAYKRATKAAMLDEFDADAERAAGVDPGAAYLKQGLYLAVQSRPLDNPASRKMFVEACQWFQTHLDACKTLDDVVEWLVRWHYEAGQMRPVSFAYTFKERLSRAEMIARYGEDVSEWQGKVRYAYTNWFQDDRGYLIKERITPELYHQRIEYAHALGKSIVSLVTIQSQRGAMSGFWSDRFRLAQNYSVLQDWSWADGQRSKGEGSTRRVKVERVVSVGLQGERRGGPAIPDSVTGSLLQRTFGLRGLQHGLWMSDDDSDTGERAAYGAFLDLATILDFPLDRMGFQGRLGLALGARGSGDASAHYEPTYRVINLTRTRGAGTLAHEWGHAMDHWLADPRAKSGAALYCSQGASSGNVALDVAFRGVMDAINGIRKNPRPEELDLTSPLTSWKDWDARADILNAWYRKIPRSDKVQWSEHALARNALLKLKAAYQRKEKKMREEEKEARSLSDDLSYLQSAKLMGEYWSRPTELFARAWESWIEDELHARGWLSNYLVTGTRNQEPTVIQKGNRMVNCYVYPVGEERARIHAAIKNLVHVIHTVRDPAFDA